MGVRTGKGLSKGLAVALVAFGALALAGTPAAAKKKPGPISEVSASTSAPGNGTVLTATATCPGKRKVVGGGFLVNPVTGNIATHTYESARVDAKSWRATAQVTDPGAPSGEAGSLTTYAYCRKRAPKLAAAVASTPLPASLAATGASNVACPGSKKLSSGGFLNPQAIIGGSFNAVVLDSYPTPAQLWSSTAASNTGGNLSSYAYCRKGKPAPSFVTAPSGPAITAGSRVSALAACPGKRSPTGGGFQQPNLNSGTLFVNESRRVGKAWQTSAVAFLVQPGQSATLLSHAICSR
jgi:hypothetical protein